MKNKKLYIAVAILTFIFAIFLLNTKVYAGSQKLNSIDYEAKLNSDGTADITEIWNIKVTDTNTLFKTFDIDRTKYKGISNVKVSEITSSGQEINFKNTGIYAYHVEKGGFYALANNSRQFEIAWGVSINGTENKTYKISYKVIDAVKNYDDCSEFYWQFIGVTNAIPAKKVTGTIKLPSEVTNKENLRAWAHGPLNGNIEITDKQTVKFEVEDLSSETMVEVRIVPTEKIFPLNQNTTSMNNFSDILAEEENWAEQANRQRKTWRNIAIAIIVITAIIGLFFICKIIKYIKVLSKIKQTAIKPEQKLDYFRDFPDENASPAEAAFLYYYDKKGAFTSNVPKIVSGTILNLALKKAISFQIDPVKKDNILIQINEKTEEINLGADEKAILEILIKTKEYKNKKTKEETVSTITMKDIEKYAKNNDTTFLNRIEVMEKQAKGLQDAKGNYSKTIEKEADKWRNTSMGYYVAAIICLFMLTLIIPLILIIPCVICGILCGKIAKQSRTLTQAGENEQEKWQALKRYMEEFSLLNEREVPELVLWEKYLVYATAFGVADKVISQLKVKYPQILDETYMINNGYTYIYMANSINLERSISGGMQRAYSAGMSARAARNYSSGGGYGGGFSGGGRRPAEVDGRNGRKIK